ncbi:hypothetical protein CYLTODRAFT_411728 [Cylindrobasidium torrendii FP15055 ss-10]|uniref:Uncharacterized protein n=1 Tax=Cylindrobasidium torrendii FP15055 ss-10 TaxID=1314674 RepID=A0A0D7B7Y7_9AGAR|nr:hypothetical protein CYLTODRAFT_411728 [Cylindrobasidium torrendii FP15055 ss-10]
MGGNQYKRAPPLDSYLPKLLELWGTNGLTRKDVWMRVRETSVDTGQYAFSFGLFRKITDNLKLPTVRRMGLAVQEIHEDMIELRQHYPKAGYREIISVLRHEKGKYVCRRVIQDWCRQFEPEKVKERVRSQLKRRRFYSAGCNALWCLDQHDKWLIYGLGLHICLDPFTGRIIWLRVWWGNRNPRLIFRYYLDAVKRLGLTQSDLGSEAYFIARGHTFIRHSLDPSLEGTLQHLWRPEKKNLPPEIAWSGLRRRLAPGVEDILSMPGKHPELRIRFDRYDPLQYNVYKWLFIPWVQMELDSYAARVNSTVKRRQKHKVLPQGKSPNDIEEFPQYHNCKNFKVLVDRDAEYLQAAEELYAPTDHATFEMVPPDFHETISKVYQNLGSPEVTRNNIWNIYEDILARLEQIPNAAAESLEGFTEPVPVPVGDEIEALQGELNQLRNPPANPEFEDEGVDVAGEDIISDDEEASGGEADDGW